MLFSLNVLVIFSCVFTLVFENPCDKTVNVIMLFLFTTVIVGKGEPIASILILNISYFS